MDVKSKAVAAKDRFHGGKIVVAALSIPIIWISGYFGIPRMPDAGDVAPAIAITVSAAVIGVFVLLVWLINTRGVVGRNVALAAFGLIQLAVTIIVVANWTAVMAAFAGFSILDTLVWGAAILVGISYVGFVSYKHLRGTNVRPRQSQTTATTVTTTPPSGAVL